MKFSLGQEEDLLNEILYISNFTYKKKYNKFYQLYDLILYNVINFPNVFIIDKKYENIDIPYSSLHY